MPGLTGFTDLNNTSNRSVLKNMLRTIRHFDSYTDDELYCDTVFHCTRTHLGIINKESQPYVIDNHLFCWLNGEFYNRAKLAQRHAVNSSSDNNLIADIYYSTKSFDFLKDINGCYTAVLYDKKNQVVHLIADRFGFKPLCWGIINGNLVWSSELKGFLEYNKFSPQINKQAVHDFLSSEYIKENHHWFEGIELVPPASVVSFDITKIGVTVKKYWSLNDIAPLKDPVDENDLIQELGMQFKRAVTNLVGADEKVGLALSGGLDSRAILAAVPDNYSPLHTFTFGQDNCLDIQIAQHASEIRKAIHHIQPITSDNWLQSRISEIWLSDGSINLYHLHEIGSCNTYRSHMDFNLSGFLGDGILGGSYLHYKDSEAYNLTNRGRRFINLANILGETRLIYRRPFFDNDFFNLTFSIPQQLRKNSYIYNKMLLNTFPEYFRKIPWQKTGFPIGYSDRHKRILRFKNNAVDKITQKMRRFGLSYIKPHKSFTDYNDWIRKEPARTIFSKILFNKNALYKEFDETHCFSKYFDEHMRGKANYSIELCVLLTFEIWLQQVFEKKYRDNETNRIYCRS